MANENLTSARLDDTEIKSALSDRVREAEEEKYLMFRSAGILYGVQVDFVNEILTEVSVTKVPLTPGYVMGVINLRGLVPPIIDFRLLLGRIPGEESCAIMLDIEGDTIGILVDGVDQTVDIPKSSILPVPTQREQEQRLVCGMCTVPNTHTTMMVLDCSQLIHG